MDTPGNMLEKDTVPFAQVVLIPPQPILGAAAEAEPDIGAVQTFLRQTVHFMHPEGAILFHQRP